MNHSRTLGDWLSDLVIVVLAVVVLFLGVAALQWWGFVGDITFAQWVGLLTTFGAFLLLTVAQIMIGSRVKVVRMGVESCALAFGSCIALCGVVIVSGTAPLPGLGKDIFGAEMPDAYQGLVLGAACLGTLGLFALASKFELDIETGATGGKLVVRRLGAVAAGLVGLIGTVWVTMGGPQ